MSPHTIKKTTEDVFRAAIIPMTEENAVAKVAIYLKRPLVPDPDLAQQVSSVIQLMAEKGDLRSFPSGTYEMPRRKKLYSPLQRYFRSMTTNQHDKDGASRKLLEALKDTYHQRHPSHRHHELIETTTATYTHNLGMIYHQHKVGAKLDFSCVWCMSSEHGTVYGSCLAECLDEMIEKIASQR